MAILYVIANASIYFCWTAELFRRTDRVEREEDLMNDQLTYRNLYKYGKSLVWYLRHRRDPNNPHGGFQRRTFILLDTGLFQNFGHNSPCVLAILISCMRKDRFGVTVGVRGQHSATLCTTLFICCTHGHSQGSKILLPGVTWIPQAFDRQLAVHGTKSINWRSIVRDKGMKTRNRLELHFSVFRAGMMIKEMYQLKQEDTFLFIDPYQLVEQGFEVTTNLNDVCKVKIGTDGLHIKNLLTTVRFDGSYADLTGYRVPRTPPQWVSLVNEFIQQLANPATALYDDSRGTTGPLAPQRIEKAVTLHNEYTKMAETLSVATDRAPTLQICDRNSVDTDACANQKNKSLLPHRIQAEPMVLGMFDPFKRWSDNHTVPADDLSQTAFTFVRRTNPSS